MDPNANLQEQIEIAIRIHQGRAILGDSRRLADLVISLHEWIAKGGFLPDAWKQIDSRRQQ